METSSFARVVGSDVSTRSLQYAARALHVDRMSERQSERVELFQGALTYEDERYAGFDAAVLMEVIEHVDPPRLNALEHVVFGAAKPGSVIVTTPNVSTTCSTRDSSAYGTRTTALSGPVNSSANGPTGLLRRMATRLRGVGSATSTKALARQPRWRSSRGPEATMTEALERSLKSPFPRWD